MKNNKGITLSALVIIIVLLVIFSTFAIYSSVESFKLIDIQKYKAQMQAIQNGLDQFYEECENVYKKNEVILNDPDLKNNSDDQIGPIDKDDFLEYYVGYKLSNSSDSIVEFVKSTDGSITNGKNYRTILGTASGYDKAKNWWKGNTSVTPNIESVAKQFDIITSEFSVQEQYFFLTKDDIKKIFDLKDIDVSDNFIVNFKKRYVFTETPIRVVKKGTENTEVDLYCLYQLDEEQKVIEYKVENFGGELIAEIVEKTQYNQTIKLTLRTQETKIKQVYFDDNTDGEESHAYPTIEEKKDLFDDIYGLGTETVYIKIKKEDSIDTSTPSVQDTTINPYNFMAEDIFGNYYRLNEGIKIKFHEPPILENNMIPFIATTETQEDGTVVKKGIVYPKTGSENINDWYDYSSYGTNFNNDIKYATAVITTDTSKYSSMKGSSFEIVQDGNFTEGTTHIVKVWIPNNMQDLVSGKGYTNIDFIGKTGIWVTAEWDYEKNKWVPLNKGSFDPTVESFSKSELKINLSDSTLKYYWKINDMDNESYKSDSGTVHGTVRADYANNQLVLTDSNADILQNIKSVSIYGRDPNGNSTPIKTIQLKEEDISSNYNILKNVNDQDISGFEGVGWDLSDNNQGTSSYNSVYKRSGNYSMALERKTEGYDEIPVATSSKINYDPKKIYYASIYTLKDPNNGSDSKVQFYWPIDEPWFAKGAGYGKAENTWTKYTVVDSRSAAFTTTNNSFRVDHDTSGKNVTIYIDDICLIDLTTLQSEYTFIPIPSKVRTDNESRNGVYNEEYNTARNWCDTFIDTKDGKNILYYYE